MTKHCVILPFVFFKGELQKKYLYSYLFVYTVDQNFQRGAEMILYSSETDCKPGK